jgi:hypothetical protein
MAFTTLSIGNELLSTTMYVLMEQWRDNLHHATAFLEAQEKVHGKGGPSQAGSTRIVQPLGFGEHSKTTRMKTGFEFIDLSVSDVFVPAVYSWAHVVRPVAISTEEELINTGEEAILSIVESRVKQTANALKRDFVKQIVQGSVAGWEDWSTLNGVDNATGFLEKLASGSQTNTVGGVSKATFSTKIGWQNQIFDGSGSFNGNGLAGLYDLNTETKVLGEGDEGNGRVILASRAGIKNLKRSLAAYERYIDSEKLDGGRMVEYWDGMMIHVEFDMPIAGTFTTADPITFYLLDLNDIYCLWDPKGYFDLTPFEKVSGNYDVRSALLRVRGQLIAKKLGTSGIGFDLEKF